MVKIRRSIKASAEEKLGIFETYGNKPCFKRECSELPTDRKQAKLLWLFWITITATNEQLPKFLTMMYWYRSTLPGFEPGTAALEAVPPLLRRGGGLT